MPLIHHGSLPEIPMRPGIRGKFLASGELGATGLSILFNEVEPVSEVPLHMHTVEESVVITEGAIWLRLGTSFYDRVGPQETVLIPPRTPHAWGNAEATTARLLFVFAGPNPFADTTYLEGAPPRLTP